MKRNKILMIGSAILFGAMVFISSCTAPAQISMKGGAQLWGETCIRCHNTPSPSTFSDVDWDIAMKHMQYRAQITREEAEKIVAFLKSAN